MHTLYEPRGIRGNRRPNEGVAHTALHETRRLSMAPLKLLPLVALSTLLLCTSQVFAGAQEYFCNVTQDFETQADGSVAPPKLGSLIGRTLAVSRSTGQVIVPYSAFFMSGQMQFKVIATRNAQNNFVTFGTEPAGSDYPAIMLLTVVESAKSQKKPFLLSAGVRALAGTCE